MTIPEGFEPHFRKSPLTDPWEPLYSRRTDLGVEIGMLAGEQHCNGRGFVHGGLISALADNAMGLSCALTRKDQAGLVTISLHVDFLRAAQKGQWIVFAPAHVKTGRSVDIAQGFVTADGERVANVSATFHALATKG